MESTVLQFYDQLAGEYHLMFADWTEEVTRQGETLARIIQSHLGEANLGTPMPSVLDCACGIGTQAIGLAKQGYRVHATDLSPGAVARARQEASAFGVNLTFDVVDFRALANKVSDTFDIVLCGDNSLSHLQEDDELYLAACQMRARLKPGGLLLASIRDYDRLLNPTDAGTADPGLPGQRGTQMQQKPRGTMPQVFDDKDGRRIVFQIWDWADDGRSYAIHQYFVHETQAGIQTTHHVSRFRALQRHELSAILTRAGFADIQWQLPAQSGFYQPLVSARNL